SPPTSTPPSPTVKTASAPVPTHFFSAALATSPTRPAEDSKRNWPPKSNCSPSATSALPAICIPAESRESLHENFHQPGDSAIPPQPPDADRLRRPRRPDAGLALHAPRHRPAGSSQQARCPTPARLSRTRPPRRATRSLQG